MRKIIMTMMVSFAFLLHATAQDRTISGKIIDEKGLPVDGVSVLSSDGRNGTKTNNGGVFTVSISKNTKSLLFSSVGFEAQRVNIGTQNTIDLTLKPTDTKLDEIVVVGYETRRKRDLSAPMSSVKGSDIANKPVGAFTNAMQGQMSGVQINSFNGVPGGAINVKIRGAASIAVGAGGSVGPLYIIDGIQLVSGNTNGLGVGNGFEATTSSSLLNGINADDIESIDVLKDPATASIYGAQAANGVVIITTKKGKQGKTKLNFNTYLGFSQVIKKLEVLDATQAVQLGYEANVNRFGPNAANTLNFLTATGGTVKNGMVDPLVNNDWQGLAFRQGFVRNFDLSASGGNEKTTFLMSGGYNKMEGHVVGSDFQKGVFRLNLDHKVDSRFSVGSTLSLSSYTQNGVLNGGSFGNPARNGFLSFPTNTPYLADGTYRRTNTGTWFGGIDNFLIYTDNNISLSNTKSLVGGVNLSYKINKHFTFRTTFSTNFSITDEKQFSDPRYSGTATNGSVSKFSRQITDFQTNQVLNYNQAFGGRKHVVTGLLGNEFRVNKNASFAAFGQGVPSPLFTTLSSTATPQAPSEEFSDFKLLGIFGKLGYTYNDKYILAVTARRDGSSRFGAGNQYGLFPSASFAWRLSNEEGLFGSKFKENNDVKLRFSYGITGSQDVLGSYGNRGLFGLSGEYIGLSGGAPTQLENKDLSWEENESYNAGIDITTLNRRVSLEVDVYKSNRSRLLLAVPIPASNGFSTINRNLGAAQIKGIDVGLKTQNINGKNFSWSTNFNFAYNKNKIIDLGAGVKQIGTLYKVGQQLNSIFTQKYAGVNPADGRPMYYDTLGNITYLPQLRDRYYLDGSLDPTFNGGMTNVVTYKSFELRFQFIYQGGNYIQNNDAAFLQRAGSTFDRNQLAFQTERWQKPGDITRVPRPYAGGTQPNANSNSLASDRFFERGDFARLKEVTLTYNFSKDVLSTLKLTAASFYLSSFNPKTWSNYTGFDPEVQGFDFGTYPQAKQMLFGLNITF